MKLFTIFLSLGLIVIPTPKYSATVTGFYADRAIVEVTVDKGYRADSYLFDFPTEENSYEAELPGAYLGKNINVTPTYGTFEGTWEGTDYNGVTKTFYQFKSYDDSIWWAITAEELGYIPEEGRAYVLLYNENVDTEENHECDPALDCDCYAYDDLFLGIYAIN